MRMVVRFLILPVVVAALLVGCSKPTGAAAGGGSSGAGGSGTGTGGAQPEIDPVYGHLTHAQPKLATVKVWLGSEEMVAEIARAQVQILTGMMYRTNMAENEAMLFVFPPANIGPKNFWMQNCTIPLSAAYITPDGTIDEIVDLQPLNETPVNSKSSNLQFVLEVRQGWFKRHNVRPGMLVRTEYGSLQDTFFHR